MRIDSAMGWVRLVVFLSLATQAMAQFGTGKEVFGVPRLVVAGDTAPGGTARVVLYSALDAGKSVVYAYSLNNQPMTLPDGRILNFSIVDPNGLPDPVFQLSTNPGAGGTAIFGAVPQFGQIDGYGVNEQTLQVPNLPALIGVTVYGVAAVLDTSLGSVFGNIAEPVAITVRDPAVPVHYIRIVDLPGLAHSRTNALNNLMNGPGNSNPLGVVRIAPSGGPVAGMGGISEAVELYQVHGFNNGPNGVNENGQGDDIDVGPVPGIWSFTVASPTPGLYGTIDQNSGVFRAGTRTTAAPSDGGPGNGTVLVQYQGMIVSKTHRTTAPDWVLPSILPPNQLAAAFDGTTTTITWSNQATYDLIAIERGGVPIGTVNGSQTSFVDPAPGGLATYTLKARRGGYVAPPVSVTATNAPFQVSLGDDDNQVIALNFNFRFFNSVYTQVFLGSNGRLMFGTPDNAPQADYLTGPSSFVNGPPSIGAWTDLDPSAGGTVTVDNQATTMTVTFANVPHKNDPTKLANFSIQLTQTMVIRIQNLSLSTFPASDNIIIGIGPGQGISTTGSINFSAVLPLAIPGTNPNDNVAEDFPDASQVDITGLLFVPVNQTTADSWRVFQI